MASDRAVEDGNHAGVVTRTARGMQGRSAGVRLKVAGVTTLFCSLAAAAYAATESEPTPIVGLFLSGGPLLTVILWLQDDARRTNVGAVQDWGYFLFLAWPLVIPWYAFKTRGRSGWRLAAGLFGLIGASSATWILVAYALRLRGAGD